MNARYFHLQERIDLLSISRYWIELNCKGTMYYTAYSALRYAFDRTRQWLYNQIFRRVSSPRDSPQ